MGNQLAAPPVVNLSDVSTSLRLVAPLGGKERRGVFHSVHCKTPVLASFYVTWTENSAPLPQASLSQAAAAAAAFPNARSVGTSNNNNNINNNNANNNVAAAPGTSAASPEENPSNETTEKRETPLSTASIPTSSPPPPPQPTISSMPVAYGNIPLPKPIRTVDPSLASATASTAGEVSSINPTTTTTTTATSSTASAAGGGTSGVSSTISLPLNSTSGSTTSGGAGRQMRWASMIVPGIVSNAAAVVAPGPTASNAASTTQSIPPLPPATGASAASGQKPPTNTGFTNTPLEMVSVGAITPGAAARNASVDVVVKVFVRQQEDRSQHYLIVRYQEALRVVEQRWRASFGNDPTSAVACNVLMYSEIDARSDRFCKLQRPYMPFSLKERLVTRPYWTKEQRLFACYQLLCAAVQLHDILGVVHGDIKDDNVLFTSNGWLYLADLSPFKPAMLPAYNPADFDYYYDTDETRNCCSAPEKFYDQYSSPVSSSGVPNVVGVFVPTRQTSDPSIGSEAGAPSADKGPPVPLVNWNDDPRVASIPGMTATSHTTSMDIFSVACVMVHILTEEPLFKLSSVLELRSMSTEERIAYVERILLDRRVEGDDLKTMLLSMLCAAPNERPDAKQILQRYTPSVFPLTFTFLSHNVIPPILSSTPDVQVQLLWSQLSAILDSCASLDDDTERMATDGLEQSTVPLDSEPDPWEREYLPRECRGRRLGATLILSTLLSISRHVIMEDSRSRVTSMLSRCAELISLELRRDVVLPYLVAFLKKPTNGCVSRILALRTIATICSTLSTFPASEATLYDDFIIPCLEDVAQSPSTHSSLLEELAVQLPKLLSYAREYLRQRQTIVSASAWRTGYDLQLHTIVAQGWEIIRSLYTHPNVSVVIAMLRHSNEVAAFLGEERTQDELIPLLTTTAASSIEVQRELYSHAIKCHLCMQSPKLKTIQFFVDEGLRQTDSVCLTNTIESICDIVSAQCLPVWASMTLVHQAIPQIMNPNAWVSCAVRRLVEVTAATYRASDVLSYLECAIRPLITHGIPLAYMNSFPSVVKSELALFLSASDHDVHNISSDTARIVGGDNASRDLAAAAVSASSLGRTSPISLLAATYVVVSAKSIVLARPGLQIPVPYSVAIRAMVDAASTDVRLLDVAANPRVYAAFIPLLETRYKNLKHNKKNDDESLFMGAMQFAPRLNSVKRISGSKALGNKRNAAGTRTGDSASLLIEPLEFKATWRQTERILYALHMAVEADQQYQSQRQERVEARRDAGQNAGVVVGSATLPVSSGAAEGMASQMWGSRGEGKVLRAPPGSQRSAASSPRDAASVSGASAAAAMSHRSGSPNTISRQLLQQRAQQGAPRDGNGLVLCGAELQPTAACLATATHHQRAILCSTYTRGALVTAGGGGEMRMWCMEAGGNDAILRAGRPVVRDLVSHRLPTGMQHSSADSVTFAKFMSDESTGLVCIGGTDGVCRVVDVEQGEIVWESNIQRGVLASCCTQNANTMLVATCSGHVTALDDRVRKPVWHADIDPKCGIISCLSPLMHHTSAYAAVAATLSGALVLFDLRFQLKVAEYHLGENSGPKDMYADCRHNPHSIYSMCPDATPIPPLSLGSRNAGPSVLLGTAHGSIRRVDLATGKESIVLVPSTIGSPVRALLSQPKRYILYSAGDDCWIRAWDLHTPSNSRTLSCPPFTSPQYRSTPGVTWEVSGASGQLLYSPKRRTPLFPTSSNRQLHASTNPSSFTPPSSAPQSSAIPANTSKPAASECEPDTNALQDDYLKLVQDVVTVPQLPQHHQDAILTLNAIQTSSGSFLVSGARDGSLKVWFNAAGSDTA